MDEPVEEQTAAAPRSAGPAPKAVPRLPYDLRRDLREGMELSRKTLRLWAAGAGLASMIVASPLAESGGEFSRPATIAWASGMSGLAVAFLLGSFFLDRAHRVHVKLLGACMLAFMPIVVILAPGEERGIRWLLAAWITLVATRWTLVTLRTLYRLQGGVSTLGPGESPFVFHLERVEQARGSLWGAGAAWGTLSLAFATSQVTLTIPVPTWGTLAIAILMAALARWNIQAAAQIERATDGSLKLLAACNGATLLLLVWGFTDAGPLQIVSFCAFGLAGVSGWHQRVKGAFDGIEAARMQQEIEEATAHSAEAGPHA